MENLSFTMPPSVEAAVAKAGVRSWLVTGVAGFIGSHLAETLLRLGQRVIGVDNFLTGREVVLEDLQQCVGEELWANFVFHRLDILNTDGLLDICAREALLGKPVDIVLHQAALGSVPRSVDDPLLSNEMNVTGFLSVLVAARKASVSRIVYASSSAVYGDCEDPIKSEGRIGVPISPYGASKRTDEVYADAFSRAYQQKLVGLRYFNVFGPRQDPNGPYAAVIPCWVQALVSGEECKIYGDGETSRDFCFVGNVVQANLLAALRGDARTHEVYNIAVGTSTSLNQLYKQIVKQVSQELNDSEVLKRKPIFEDFRDGDIRNSLAAITKAKEALGYQASHTLEQGLKITVPWFVRQHLKRGRKGSS